MPNPKKIQADATLIVLHAWVQTYFVRRAAGAPGNVTSLSSQLQTQAGRLQESAIQLAAAVEKMRLANAKLAQRMAEHKAFFAKYQRPQ
jgi:hypothetical protein